MAEIIVKMDKHLKLKGGEYVQDIVRCKECSRCVSYDGNLFCTLNDLWTYADDFCSYGERREP